MSYSFLKNAGRILNSGQSQTLMLTGNIHDLFQKKVSSVLDDGIQNLDTEYVPLINLICSKWNVQDRILVVYELNGPIRFVSEGGNNAVRDAWMRWRTGFSSNELAVKKMLAPKKVQPDISSRIFDDTILSAAGNPTVALELLRQICLCSRSLDSSGKPYLKQKLIVFIEAADMVIPQGEISRLSDTDRHRIAICHDWFMDPGFMHAGDAVMLMAESRSLVNQRVARLPQILEIPIKAPDLKERTMFIDWFNAKLPSENKLKLWGTVEDLAKLSAGLSIHALMQMLKAASYMHLPVLPGDVVAKVEAFIQSQLGEDIIEFKKPGHRLEQVVGFSKLKTFLDQELIPRFRSTGADALPGAAVCGPIGGGKTFIFEAVASELDMVVLVLKNIRSQWFGQTDVIFERLRRVLDALAKVLIFVDEADTQFGGVGAGTHSTERRLTGKIQAMMSDPALRGRVIWLLMTARINLLSPDIRRPGRVGDLIIPILDPTGNDRKAFIEWMVSPVLKRKLTATQQSKLSKAVKNYSAAGYASLRSELKARADKKGLTFKQILDIIQDHIEPAIGETRRYQTLQALINCTRRSLLPDPDMTDEQRADLLREIRKLEMLGIH